MEKQPFTPEGVLALQTWLYQLPPLDFDAEIIAMTNDFEAWSLAHLELDEIQLDFYLQLSPTAKQNLAYLVTLAATYKNPVSLIQHQLKSGGEEPPEDKLFKPKSTLQVTSHIDGSYEVEGDLTIDVSYVY